MLNGATPALAVDIKWRFTATTPMTDNNVQHMGGMHGYDGAVPLIRTAALRAEARLGSATFALSCVIAPPPHLLLPRLAALQAEGQRHRGGGKAQVQAGQAGLQHAGHEQPAGGVLGAAGQRERAVWTTKEARCDERGTMSRNPMALTTA